MRKPEKRQIEKAAAAAMSQTEYLDRLDILYRRWIERATGMERKQKLSVWLNACAINVGELANSDIARDLTVMIERHALNQKMYSGQDLHGLVSRMAEA